MPNARTNAAVALAALLALAACSDDGSPLWPTLDGGDPAGTPAPRTTTTAPTTAPSGNGADIEPLFGAGSPPPPPATPTTGMPAAFPPATATGLPAGAGQGPIGMPAVGSASSLLAAAPSNATHVGLRIAALQQDLQRLRDAMAIHSARFQEIRARSGTNAAAYQQNVAPIYARLQIGTTPGNPIMTQQWREAELRLNIVNSDIDALNTLGNDVASDAALASYLLDATRATYGLSGAYEEDHRQLALLEDEVNRTVISIDRMLNDISADISRQGNYVAAERANLTALALAIKTGSFFDAPPVGQIPGTQGLPAAPASMAPNPGPAVGTPGAGPLVVIRFDRPTLNFEPELRAPVQEALQRNPNATFQIVGIAAPGSRPGPVQNAMERVYRALTRNGVPAENVALSADTAAVPNTEVHIYVR